MNDIALEEDECILCKRPVSVGDELCAYCYAGVRDAIEEEEGPAALACEYCGPTCYRGAAHNARMEDNAKWTN